MPRRAWPSASRHPCSACRTPPARWSSSRRGSSRDRGAVLYRGEWCPFCNLELRALQAALPRLRARGASLIAISPQSPDHSLSITEKAGLTFDVLSDARQQVIRAYRLQFTVPADLKDLHLNVFGNDLSAHTADGSWDLPIPATFVIDQAGIVRARHVSADYTTRMDRTDIEAALDALA